MEWILQLHPLPPWMGEVLRTSERACTVRAYLGRKHHEAPWGEYYNSSPSPPWIEEVLKNKGEGLHSESLSWLEEPWSTMEWILQLHSSPHGWERYLKEGLHSDSLSSSSSSSSSCLFIHGKNIRLINNYSSSPNGLWVNSPWGQRPNGLLTQRPWGREE